MTEDQLHWLRAGGQLYSRPSYEEKGGGWENQARMPGIGAQNSGRDRSHKRSDLGGHRGLCMRHRDRRLRFRRIKHRRLHQFIQPIHVCSPGIWVRCNPWARRRLWNRREPWARRKPRGRRNFWVAATHEIAWPPRVGSPQSMSPEPMEPMGSRHPMGSSQRPRCRSIRGRWEVDLGSICDRSGVELSRSKVGLGSAWGRCGIDLGPIRGQSDVDLGSKSRRSEHSGAQPRRNFRPQDLPAPRHVFRRRSSRKRTPS